MKYGDALDRTPTGLSRRQFLAGGGQHMARLAAGVLLPAGGGRLIEAAGEMTADEAEAQTDRREDQASASGFSSSKRGRHGREQLEP